MVKIGHYGLRNTIRGYFMVLEDHLAQKYDRYALKEKMVSVFYAKIPHKIIKA